MDKDIKNFLSKNLKLSSAKEVILSSSQNREIVINNNKYLNFSANNYLGLASHPEIIKAAHHAIDYRGYGLASARFISGTQDIHKELENKIASFLGKEDAMLFSSCFDANIAIFSALFGSEDAIISDELNHASIIDGIRLSKAQRWIYQHSVMGESEVVGKKGLEQCLKEAQHCRFRIIVTDGVFSMEGEVAKLKEICKLAEKYNALIMIDDSHATGFIGKNGKGTPELLEVMDKIDIITTTFSKALGGSSGGCIISSKEIIQWLRKTARPYIFSNTLTPMVVGATSKALDLVIQADDLRERLFFNTKYFRQKIKEAGFDIISSEHPIISLVFDNNNLANYFAEKLFVKGIYVVAFSYPVLPKGQSRIRIQISALHTEEDIDQLIKAIVKVKIELEDK